MKKLLTFELFRQMIQSLKSRDNLSKLFIFTFSIKNRENFEREKNWKISINHHMTDEWKGKESEKNSIFVLFFLKIYYIHFFWNVSDFHHDVHCYNILLYLDYFHDIEAFQFFFIKIHYLKLFFYINLMFSVFL